MTQEYGIIHVFNSFFFEYAPLRPIDGFTALSHSSCAPCAERRTSVTTLKSGKTRTVSWSFSWHNVLWLPFKTEIRLESEARKRPVEEGCVSFTVPLPGDGSPG